MILINNDIAAEFDLIDAEWSPLDPIHQGDFWREWFPDFLSGRMTALQDYIEENLQAFEARWASTPRQDPVNSWIPPVILTFRAHARNMQIDLSGL